MEMPELSLTLSEWETRGPTQEPALAERMLGRDGVTRQIAQRLEQARMLRVTELRHGLEIQTFSHVGRIRLGPLQITIQPKLPGVSFLRLLRYAYGFRRLHLLTESTHPVEALGFEDLLICQLHAEARELLSRGLRRDYLQTREKLSSPRGRIDLEQLARDGGTLTAALPCRHFPRVEDTLVNRVLLAGLQLSGNLAGDLELRRESLRLAVLLQDQVRVIRLDRQGLDRAERQLNRLTSAYAAALAIIRLLVESRGILLEGEPAATPLPGLLFDMNRFFQALLSRFLRENLPGYQVREEQGLQGMLRYDPRHNPRRQRAPTPRPDYVVTREGIVCAILDAKYRDLWTHSLPREMLYQLAIYAISQRQQPQSCILYPTVEAQAREARIHVTDPVFGHHLGTVGLRPVLLPQLEQLVSGDAAGCEKARAALARQLALGDSSPLDTPRNQSISFR